MITLCLVFAKQPGVAEPLKPLLPHAIAYSSSLVQAVGATFRVSQLPDVATIPQFGDQINFNGKLYTVAWSRHQDQISITDMGLVQLAGVDLLSTGNATQQPIAWFTDPQVSPPTLAAWQAGQYRYLNITPLVEQLGWQVQENGSVLSVSTPSAKVTSVRQGQQAWGDRIVVELDQIAPWQVEEQADQFTVTVDAPIDPAVVQQFRASAGSRLGSLKVEANQNRTVIRVSTTSPMRPRVWSIPNPNRLLIDIRPDSLPERDILWTPGVRWRQQMVSLGASRFPVVWLDVDPHQPGVSLKPITSNSAGVLGTAPLITTAQQSRVVGAINGGFFNRNTQLPLGAIRRDERWVSGPILGRGAIAWNGAGDMVVGRLKLQETLTTSTGQRLPVVYLNSGYVGAGVYRHTRDWGGTYSPILNHELIVTVQDGKVTQRQQSTSAGRMTVPIPEDGYLLVIREDETASEALLMGSQVALEATTQPAEFSHYPDIMGAGPLLVQNGQVVLNATAEAFSQAFQQQGASRSVIATSATGNLMLVTVHPRVDGSGPTLTEAAQLMQQIGAVNALNLDGGSSSALYLGGRLLDRSPTTAARVHNGIGVFVQTEPIPN